MVRLSRIARDYEEAGSVNALLALWGFVDEATFLTKAGHLGLVYRVRGVDDEGLTHAERHGLVHRFEAALRQLDEHCLVYQYLIKRTIDPIVSARCARPIAQEAIQRRTAYLNERRPDLYDLALHLVLLYEAPATLRKSTGFERVREAPNRTLGERLSTRRTVRLLEDELERAIATLRQQSGARCSSPSSAWNGLASMTPSGFSDGC